eukprot:EG_transcript_17780
MTELVKASSGAPKSCNPTPPRSVFTAGGTISTTRTGATPAAAPRRHSCSPRDRVKEWTAALVAEYTGTSTLGMKLRPPVTLTMAARGARTQVGEEEGAEVEDRPDVDLHFGPGFGPVLLDHVVDVPLDG